MRSVCEDLSHVDTSGWTGVSTNVNTPWTGDTVMQSCSKTASISCSFVFHLGSCHKHMIIIKSSMCLCITSWCWWCNSTDQWTFKSCNCCESCCFVVVHATFLKVYINQSLTCCSCRVSCSLWLSGWAGISFSFSAHLLLSSSSLRLSTSRLSRSCCDRHSEKKTQVSAIFQQNKKNYFQRGNISALCSSHKQLTAAFHMQESFPWNWLIIKGICDDVSGPLRSTHTIPWNPLNQFICSHCDLFTKPFNSQ